MFNAEVRRLLAQVIISWQVLAVTVILIIYISLVNYVTRTHHRGLSGFSMPKVKKDKKAKKKEEPVASETDELELEE